MKIIEILKQRSDNAIDDVKIDLKLYNLADNLEKRSRAHLKRITTILSEFDIHDEKHSEKVASNIEQLLGDETLNSLSSYELFLLHLSAFFHDCAMAPSDWEINTMKLTEGNDSHSQSDFSIKHDLKTPLKLSSAIELIKERKDKLYKIFEGDVQRWIFSPNSEDDLIKYLGNLLVEYQNFRNGFADQLKKVKNQAKFEELNDFIRIDFIRATHHSRIETYIKNLDILFGNAFEQPAWGKKLAHDLALICRSHGEDATFINSFSVNAQYYGADSANLQFVAIMLRLGDVIHFSYDRAPIDLRTSRLFKSEYSFQQWAIKNSGANYSIENGKISFRAYCESPDTYFKLHEYIDWIESEIQNYFKFQRQWEKSYIDNLQDKVDRINIVNDNDSFLPKRGLNFSLNQKKILELLMGVGLYKDKFACLRELYQNSLDACRCMLSQNNLSNIISDGKIEFNIEKEGDKVYLTCTDNGIGMTKDIIEKYLLKIGNSYYKSSDFYKQQANWGGNFTPTSQFGIGILSCFMIGDKIEITTKTKNDDWISCSINGPHEHFYYKETLSLEKEKLPTSGTIVRILLNSENQNVLNNSKIEKLGLLLFGININLPEEFDSYLPLFENWNEHLYNKINHFVQIIPDNIIVKIGVENGESIKLLSKPILIDINNKQLELQEKDSDLLDYLNNRGRFYPLKQKYNEIKQFIENYPLLINCDGVEYRTTLTLPKKGFILENMYITPEVGSRGFSIDGIFIDNSNSIRIDNYYSHELHNNGIINFTGELRPQLSVDRTSIVDYPDKCEKVAEEISKLLIKVIIETTKNHIEKYKFKSTDKEFHLLWEYVFEKIGFADILFINDLSNTEYGNIIWEKLSNVLNKQLSIKEFLSSKEITLINFNLSTLDVLSKKLILTKLISAKKINIENSNISIEQENLIKTNLIKKRRSFSEFDILICTDEWNPFDDKYDIVSNLYPLIPQRLFNLLDRQTIQKINDKTKILHSYSNGLTSLFSQSPLLINEGLGLYIDEKVSLGKKKNNIYNFENKRSNIGLFELNEKHLLLKNKEKYVLMVYISPKDLNKEETKELEKYVTKDPSYVKGVREGWSLLVTSMDKENIIIYPGRTTRDVLVSKISKEFWEEYNDYTFKFTDNTVLKKQE
jgi:molecular chaperone HtpG